MKFSFATFLTLVLVIPIFAAPHCQLRLAKNRTAGQAAGISMPEGKSVAALAGGTKVHANGTASHQNGTLIHTPDSGQKAVQTPSRAKGLDAVALANKNGGPVSSAGQSKTTKTTKSTSVSTMVKPTTRPAVKPTVAPAPTKPPPNMPVKPPTTSKADGGGIGGSGGGEGADPLGLVALHNNFRAQYGAPPVTWDTKLAAYARDYASKCGEMNHSGGPYGENLAAGTSSSPSSGLSAAGGFDRWAGEAKDYDPVKQLYSHFTQVVWKKTTSIGCARVDCGAGTVFRGSKDPNVYIVCEYDPPGNAAGQFTENVGKKPG